MEAEILLALIAKMIDEKVADYMLANSLSNRGPRGFHGPPGEEGPSGKPFIWEEHSEEIKNEIKKAVPKFDDLDASQIEALRGPRGREGSPGKSFVWDDHSEAIASLVKASALKFSDLSMEEIAAIRGRPGRDGRDGRPGKDFDFSEHQANIDALIKKEVEILKLKFSDLTDEEKEQLRGPRGQRGKSGRDFIFEEHREFFEGLKLKFSDLTEEDLNAIKLKFADLAEDERNSLKLKFADLTDEDKIAIRGHRGQRGRPGLQGPIGESGPQGLTGPRGMIGPAGIMGLTGPRGLQGIDGEDGQDAATIEEFGIAEYPGKEISLKITLSDGTVLETNKIKFPTPQLVQQILSFAGGGSSGGGSIATLSDVLLTDLQDGDILKFNAGLDKWVNVPDTSPSPGGLLTKSGTILPTDFAGTPKKFSVVFATVFPALTDYSIVLSGVDSRSFTYEAKDNTGFTINTNANSDLTGEVSWQTIETGED